MIITITDCATYGYCCTGMRLFAKKHKLDYEKFAKEGIDEEVLKATKDGMALEVIERIKNGRK